LSCVIGAPIDGAGYNNGVELMPAELRAAGLVKQLGLPDYGDWPVSLSDRTRDLATGMIAYRQVLEASTLIDKKLTQLLRQDERPLVVGGCCTLLIGVAAALRKHYGRVGLAFIDGHHDFYDGQSSVSGEGADMELAILCGIGAPELVNLAGFVPMLDEEDIVVLGPQDEAYALSHGAPNPKTLRPKMRIYSGDEVRSLGCESLAQKVREGFEGKQENFWLHLDLDVLDQTELPAIDAPIDNGLTWQETTDLLKPLASSPALIGASITIYNPKLDRDGRYSERIVQMLTEVF
jgi:arginase